MRFWNIQSSGCTTLRSSCRLPPPPTSLVTAGGYKYVIEGTQAKFFKNR
jgi:hypothetical protein